MAAAVADFVSNLAVELFIEAFQVALSHPAYAERQESLRSRLQVLLASDGGTEAKVVAFTDLTSIVGQSSIGEVITAAKKTWAAKVQQRQQQQQQQQQQLQGATASPMPSAPSSQAPAQRPLLQLAFMPGQPGPHPLAGQQQQQQQVAAGLGNTAGVGVQAAGQPGFRPAGGLVPAAAAALAPGAAGQGQGARTITRHMNAQLEALVEIHAQKNSLPVLPPAVPIHNRVILYQHILKRRQEMGLSTTELIQQIRTININLRLQAPPVMTQQEQEESRRAALALEAEQASLRAQQAQLLELRQTQAELERQQDAAPGVVPALPYTPPPKAELVLNELPTLQLLVGLAKQYEVQGVAPACFYLLEEAVTQHLAQLLKGMAKAARQRADPARDVTGMRKWGVNVRAGISKYIKDDKQVRERRAQAEQDELHKLASAKQPKKMDEERKAKVAQAKEAQAKAKAIGSASGAIGQAFSFKNKKESSKKAGAAGTAANTEGKEAASAPAASGGLRGSFAAKLKSGSLSAGLSKSASDAAAGKGESAPKRVKTKPAAAPSSGNAPASTNPTPSASKPSAEQGAAKAQAGGPAGQQPGGGTASANAGMPSKPPGAAPAIPPVVGVKREADSMMRKPGTGQSGVPAVLELTTRDLLAVMERDVVLSKHRIVWRMMGDLLR